MPQLTIIVPVYNVENYLEQCLTSIQKQTFTDFHVLVFNDGSTDGSLAIMKEFASKDPRFEVINKPNEGYGATCNRGLNAAKTEWVAIVEPDDFIAPEMYEELLTAASSEQASHPEIVKGSYWEYYDPADGYADALRKPNLSIFAPKRRTVSNIEGNIELLVHHPSIWSAIYRRSFLDNNKLRFVEAKGAGWVDNPFYFAALNLAQNIAWVPRPYYYYRMTNADASRYLKDFHLPFDRLREMRAFADSHSISRRAMGVLYARELDYIDQVVNKYGFNEADPELNKLIHEVIDPMDSTIIFSDPHILPKFRTYYMDFTGTGQQISEHGQEVTPHLTVVVAVHNQRDAIAPFFSQLLTTTDFPFEVVAVDCKSSDRTSPAIRHLTRKDKRVRLIESDSESLSEGLNTGLAASKGAYVLFADVNAGIAMKDIPELLATAHSHHAVLVECGIRADFAEETMLRAQTDSSITVINSGRYIFSQPAAVIKDFLLAIRPNELGNTFFHRSFLTDHSITAGEADGTSEMVLLARTFATLLDGGDKAGNVLTATRSVRDTVTDTPVTQPFYRQKLYAIDDKTPKATAPAVFQAIKELSGRADYASFERSLKRVLLESFSADVHACVTTESLDNYLDSIMQPLTDTIGDSTAQELDSEGPFNEFQRLSRNDRSFFYLHLYMQTLNQLKKSKDRNRRLVLSTRYQVGEKIIRLGRTLTPTGIVANIRKKITQRLR
jgi:glycosyltransferase involved in cell wall biosynthesis